MRGTARRAWTRASLSVVSLSVAFGSLSVATALWGCASLLEIKALPVAVDGGRTSLSDVLDAPEPCVEDVGFCQKCPRVDFCDDFEQGTFNRGWNGLPGFPTAVLHSGGVGNVVVQRDDAGVGSNVLIAQATSTKDESAAVVLAAHLDVGARKPAGMELQFQVRPTAVSWAMDGGTARRTLAVLAVGSHAANQGVGLLLTEDGDPSQQKLGLILQQRSLGGSSINTFPETDLITLMDTADRATLHAVSIAVVVTIATAQRLKELKLACADPPGEDAGPESLRFHVKVGAFVSKCTALRDALTDPTWFQTVALAVGASVSDYGSASVVIDDVSVKFLE